MSYNILGISAGFHDAAVSLVSETGDILFAGHSERYTKNKHDKHLTDDIIMDVLHYGQIDEIVYYENPYLKKLRQLYAGQIDDLCKEPLLIRNYLREHVSSLYNLVDNKHVPLTYVNHHLAHAAAGFQTSPYDRATVVVIDAIGEWDVISIWGAYIDAYGQAKYKKLWSQKYPHSIGLLYSAFTDRLGLRPMDEEYIVMGMAGWGKHYAREKIHNKFVNDDYLTLKENVHSGIEKSFLGDELEYDIAASIQAEAEAMIYKVMEKAKSFDWSNNLVYMGGVALNCLANRNLGNYFKNVWIMPNPGDAGSSLGAAALKVGTKLNWNGPYLGLDICRPYPVAELIEELKTNKIVGVANGRAEFGPRALGNRSLLADPRGSDIKDKVNAIKQRQNFRPFAPVILEEYAYQYFEMPQVFQTSPYMQVVAKCKFPTLFPAIIHVDGTSRVQTVSKDTKSGIRKLLEEWHVQTGCPMLLNTSLNIRGEPMVNDLIDAKRFEVKYGVKVL